MNQRGSGMDHKTMIALHWWKIREHLDCELWWWWLEQRMQDSLSLSLSLKSKRRVLNDLPAWLGEWVSAVGNFFGYCIRLAKKQQLWQIYLCYVSQVVVNFGRCMQKLLVQRRNHRCCAVRTAQYRADSTVLKVLCTLLILLFCVVGCL